MSNMKDFYDKHWKRRLNEYGADYISGVSLARSKLILDLLPKQEDIGSVLDVGCGSGTTLHSLSKYRNFAAYGIDISDTAVESATNKGIKAKVADATVEIPFPEDHFEIVICSETLEHVIFPEQVLLNIRKVVKESGICIFSVPNAGHIYNRLKLLFGKNIFSEGRYSVHEHLHFWTKSSFIELLQDNGYDALKVTGRRGKLIGPVSLTAATLFVKAKPIMSK